MIVVVHFKDKIIKFGTLNGIDKDILRWAVKQFDRCYIAV